MFSPSPQGTTLREAHGTHRETDLWRALEAIGRGEGEQNHRKSSLPSDLNIEHFSLTHHVPNYSFKKRPHHRYGGNAVHVQHQPRAVGGRGWTLRTGRGEWRLPLHRTFVVQGNETTFRPPDFAGRGRHRRLPECLHQRGNDLLSF